MKNTRFTFLLSLLIGVSATGYSQSNSQDSLTKEKQAVGIKEDFSDDWAALSYYQKENKLLGIPKHGEKRVVFLGSSIFERWKLLMPEFFNNKPYLNRGISGQISPQLLVRFKQDVIDLHPKVVIILAGSNDIAANYGHITNQTIMDNIATMVELAKLHHIRVILCAYLPVYDYPWRKGIQPAGKIMALNGLIKDYVRSKRLVLLDYFTPFADERNGQKAELTTDGVHPNEAGYRIMASITEEAIHKIIN